LKLSKFSNVENIWERFFELLNENGRFLIESDTKDFERRF